MIQRKLQPREVARSYKQVELAGRYGIDVLVLIYETLIAQFRRAIIGIDTGDVLARNDAVKHAITLMGDLRYGLDLEGTSDLGPQLERFYLQATRNLLVAHRHADVLKFRELETEFVEVLAVWKTKL
jgi:flagellin-specific chaperone FliS